MADELKEDIDHLPRYINVGEGTALDKSFLQPLGEVDYSNTKAEISIGDINLSLAFEPVDQADRDNLRLDADRAKRWMLLSIENPYILNDFTLTHQNGEHTLKLRDILPDDATVIFDPSGVNDGENDESSVSRKTIFLDRDPASPSGLVILLHEACHFMNGDVNNQALTSSLKSLNRKYDDLSSEEAAVIIKSERDAWAFSLRKLRPFFTKDGAFTKSGFFTFMRYYLNGYGSHISEKITSDVEAKKDS